MDLRYLKAFIATVKTGSFSGAAHELKIAQSAVSRQIKLLEESTRCDLLIRSSKKIILTEKGKALYRLASEFVGNVDRLLDAQSERAIRIGIVEGLLGSWFHQVVVDFYGSYEHSMKIFVASFGELEKSLNEDNLDIIFTTENLQNDLVTSLKIFNEKAVLISRTPIAIDKLHEQRWIVYSDEDLLFKLPKKKKHKILEVNSMPTILQLVKAGIGIAAVPEHILSPEDKFCIQDIPGHQEQNIYLASMNYHHLPQHIAALIHLVKKSRDQLHAQTKHHNLMSTPEDHSLLMD
jgi:DNA-binding transcriptional LysR family regulator